MLNICVFGGTTEGRELTEYLSDKDILLTVCVATEYGEEAISEKNVSIHVGKLDCEEMIKFFNKNKFDLIIDATHPYAEIATKNIKAASKKTDIKYLRLNRDTSEVNGGICFLDTENAVDYLSQTSGNILLTTGSNELNKFTKIPDFKKRIYPRVLPLDTSLEACKNNGYDTSHIIAMTGPFTKELNKAIIKAFDIRILVTKESGDAGGFKEKIEAARECNAECVIINRPNSKEGYSFDEVISYLNSHSSRREVFALKNKKPKISIIGTGVGDISQMTIGAYETIKHSDMIIGAKRILENCAALNKPTHCAFMPDEISECINNHSEYKNFAILMSGDVGFYSGAKKLLDTLKNCDVNIICGISSPVYLCGKLGISWDDISLSSLHGRDMNIIHSVKTSFRTFTLAGGDDGINNLCELLCEYNFGEVKLYVGERLSYKDEKITVGTPNELRKNSFDRLASVIIENKRFAASSDIGIDDEKFIRLDKIPMTKSEVRAVSISKLKLSNNSVAYDIGAGSGSVAVEMAVQAYKGTVYAIEKNREAIKLINKNKIHFSVSNLEVIEGLAPDVMEALPAPTHAFIGGSSGSLSDIIESLLEKNKDIKIVINAITLETISEALSCIKKFNFENSEIVNLSVSKSKKLGNYNMMTGQNPIYIITCQK